MPLSKAHGTASVQIAPLLRANGIGVSFRSGDGGTIRVLRDISLGISSQEVVALLGPSGCGKTTLLKVLSGLLRPTTGEVLLDLPSTIRRGLDITFVFQRPTLVPWLTVEDNVFLPYRIAHVPLDSNIHKRAEELFRIVRLHGFKKLFPHELSGGMQMRVSLMRALLPMPSLLFMDEPFSALDEGTRIQLSLETLRLTRSTQTSVVLVTHSIQEAALMGTRLLQMTARPGRIASEFKPEYGAPRDQRLLDNPTFIEFCAGLRDQLVHD